jgi:hypothetical protein
VPGGIVARADRLADVSAMPDRRPETPWEVAMKRWMALLVSVSLLAVSVYAQKVSISYVKTTDFSKAFSDFPPKTIK